MQAYAGQQPQIVWGKQIDATGYFRGTFRDGREFLAIAIAVPGRGSPPHPGPFHDVVIGGEKTGRMPNLKAAQALAELQLLTPLRRRTTIAPRAELDRLMQRHGRSI
jgi:hypothetical protein